MNDRVITKDHFLVMVYDEIDVYDVNFMPLELHTENHTVLRFQNGSIPERGKNGLTNEILISILIDRIRRQDSEVPCMFNAQALSHLTDALCFLEDRTADRKKRGVEGTVER